MLSVHKTIKQIDAALARDGGAAFRTILQQEIANCTDAFRAEDDRYRSHLGGSQIGKKCERMLWLAYRWTHIEPTEPKMVRLFNRGHLEEARFIALFKQAGINLWTHDPNTGEQFRVSHLGGHFGSALDGVFGQIPDWPAGVSYGLGEFKTHNLKSFTKLLDTGVRKNKPEHWDQMQFYMGKNNLPVALYFATCKDNDELYAELVHFNHSDYQRILSKAERIIASPVPLPRLPQAAPTFNECKYCDMQSVCLGGKKALMNCRTCVNSFPAADGKWYCRAYSVELNKEQQKAGCGAHQYIAEL
jgi:hypothetical protein